MQRFLIIVLIISIAFLFSAVQSQGLTLLAFINRWKVSSQDVPMPELMEAIVLRKSGTGC